MKRRSRSHKRLGINRDRQCPGGLKSWIRNEAMSREDIGSSLRLFPRALASVCGGNDTFGPWLS
jgi:hypothetical protein